MADIIFSKSVRRQLLGIDLVYTLIENLKKNNKLNCRQKACVDRITKRIESIRAIHCDNKIFSNKNFKRYSKLIEKIKKNIKSLDEKQLSFEFYNAVLLNVEDTRDQVQQSRHKKLKIDWNFLNQSLYTLYTYANIPDPITEYQYCKSGQKIGESLQAIIEQ